MFAFALSRLSQAVPVLLAISLIGFAMFAYVGDPVLIAVGQEHSEAQRQLLASQLGLDQPFYIQYLRFLWGALHGDFGISYSYGRPVAALIAERLPATLELAFAAFAVALMGAVPLGVYTGISQRPLVSRSILLASLVGASAPTFVVGILLILCFSVGLGWFPSFGRGEVVHVGQFWSTGLLTRSGLRALVLPAIALGSLQMAMILRLIRAEIMRATRASYLRFARARGLPSRSIYFVHALRNALVPVITTTGVQLGNLIAFSLVTESVFHWPGLGLLFVSAVRAADIPVMAAYLMLAGTTFVAVNLCVDLCHYAIDPRLRAGAAAASA